MPQIPVEVRPVIDPEGRLAVLLQLPDGYITVMPEDAVDLAQRLLSVAQEVIVAQN